MTRKDYIAIAAAIRSTNDRICMDTHINSAEEAHQRRGVRRAAAALADALADDNPRFDAARFLKECGYAGEVRATQLVDPLRVRKDRAGLNLQEELSRKAWADREETERQPRHVEPIIDKQVWPD